MLFIAEKDFRNGTRQNPHPRTFADKEVWRLPLQESLFQERKTLTALGAFHRRLQCGASKN
jgi:hypothetical protein